MGWKYFINAWYRRSSSWSGLKILRIHDMGILRIHSARVLRIHGLSVMGIHNRRIHIRIVKIEKLLRLFYRRRKSNWIQVSLTISCIGATFLTLVVSFFIIVLLDQLFHIIFGKSKKLLTPTVIEEVLLTIVVLFVMTTAATFVSWSIWPNLHPISSNGHSFPSVKNLQVLTLS